jgi:hypothetical protein
MFVIALGSKGRQCECNRVPGQLADWWLMDRPDLFRRYERMGDGVDRECDTVLHPNFAH